MKQFEILQVVWTKDSSRFKANSDTFRVTMSEILNRNGLFSRFFFHTTHRFELIVILSGSDKLFSLKGEPGLQEKKNRIFRSNFNRQRIYL